MQKYSFSPRMASTIATIVLLPILIWLGFWQLNRAHQKQLLIDNFNALKQAKPVHLAQLQGNIDDYRYYPFEIKGQFDNLHTFLLDNRTHNHQVGYHVLTPFFPDSAQKQAPHSAILVNRGWIAAGPDRQHLPPIVPVSGSQTLHGIISIPSDKAFTLSDTTENQTTWPRRIETINLEKIVNQLGYPLHNFVILLAPHSPFGYVREWSPMKLNPAKNTGYAVQWFLLAIVLLIIFLVVNIHRREEITHDDTSQT